MYTYNIPVNQESENIVYSVYIQHTQRSITMRTNHRHTDQNELIKNKKNA